MHARLMVIFVFASVIAAAAQQPQPAAAPPYQQPAVTAAEASTAAEVLAFEKAMEQAVIKGDVKFLATITPADFRFTHGDGWTSGGQPLRVDTKETWLAAVAKKPYLTRDLDPVGVELHDDIAITYGRYKMFQTSSPNGPETSVWFERLYAKQGGHWMYLSHRTVHGPLREGAASTTSK